jgi:small-conductance mechanosensitive channel
MTTTTAAPFTLANKNAIMLEKSNIMSSMSLFGNDNSHNLVKKMIETRISEIDQWLQEFEKLNSNYSQFMDYLLTDDIKETRVTKTTIYNERKVLTYAPTQVGKTNAIINIVKDCVSRGISIVISSDNKKDQMIQLFNRLVKTVEEDYDTFKNCFITTVDNKNFDSIVENMEEYNTFVICLLDNKTQIQKTYEKIISIHEQKQLGSVCIINDEGDVVTKARNITDVANQPESHKKWIEFTQKTSDRGISVKRVFVSATPENVVYIHKPGYLWDLSIPDNYVGHDKINFNELNDFSSQQITRILAREVRLRKQEGGIILYCVERNKDSDENDNNQMKVFNDIILNLKQTGLDAVTMYNSDGIKVVFRLKKQKTMFINKIETLDLKYTMDNNIINVNKRDIVISKFYGYLQSCDCKVVLTIGKDLISRGISFVSDHKENPLTATTMIYKPGHQLHCVALCQAIGRLTGTAQSKLSRRLYTTDDVYNNYMTFIENQKEIIKAIKENGNKVDDSLISDIALWKMSRPVDRKTLKLEKDMVFWEDTEDMESDSGYTTDESDENRMKQLVDLWWNANTIIGKILKFVYESQDGVSENELKNFIENNNYSRAWFSDLYQSNKEYKYVFERLLNGITKIKKEAKQYIKHFNI